MTRGCASAATHPVSSLRKSTTSCSHVTMTTPTFASRESVVAHSAATGGHAMVVPARASAVEAQAAAGTEATAASATTATALPQW